MSDVDNDVKTIKRSSSQHVLEKSELIKKLVEQIQIKKPKPVNKPMNTGSDIYKNK